MENYLSDKKKSIIKKNCKLGKVTHENQLLGSSVPCLYKTVTDGISYNFSETISIIMARNKGTARKQIIKD